MYFGPKVEKSRREQERKLPESERLSTLSVHTLLKIIAAVKTKVGQRGLSLTENLVTLLSMETQDKNPTGAILGGTTVPIGIKR